MATSRLGMETLRAGDLIEVIGEHAFRAEVQYASNGGTAALIVEHGAGPHVLYARRNWDPNAEGWLLDDGEVVKVRKLS